MTTKNISQPQVDPKFPKVFYVPTSAFLAKCKPLVSGLHYKPKCHKYLDDIGSIAAIAMKFKKPIENKPRRMPHDPINDKVCQPLYPMCRSRLPVRPTNSFVAFVHITCPAGQWRPTLQTFRLSVRALCPRFLLADHGSKSIFGSKIFMPNPWGECLLNHFATIHHFLSAKKLNFHVDVEGLKRPWHSDLPH